MFCLIPLKPISLFSVENCLALGLPDPDEKNEIDGVKLPRYVYLDEGRRIFKSKGAKDETTTIFNKYLELHRTSESLDVQLIPVSVLWGRSPGMKINQVYLTCVC